SEVVTIAGANCGATQGTSTVAFNGTLATPTAWSASSITVPVPSGATTGNVVVTVGGQASNGGSFTVTVPPPSIASLTPSSGAVGTVVTITGANFGATQGTSTVAFNGTPGTPTAWSATSITVPAPSGATTGNVVVTVNGQASNGVSFTVTVPLPLPNITTLTPTSGPIGTAVTIAGANFGAAQGSSTVKFNGVLATPIAWSATSITVPVPPGATTGSVGVTTTAGWASSPGPFTVVSAMSVVQRATLDAGTATSAALAFPGTTGAGNFVAVVIRAGRRGQALTVGDSRGNAYQRAVLFDVTSDLPDGDTLGIFYAS